MVSETSEDALVMLNTTLTLQKMAQDSRMETVLNTECQKIIEDNSLVWNRKINKRKIDFWHCLQNGAKAELYDEWLTESPNYLPLKYRPKINENDTEILLEIKSNQAQEKYVQDIKLMQHYSKQHEVKVRNNDSEMAELVEEWTDSEKHRRGIIKIWEEKCRQNAQYSQQLWTKRSEFLQKKKMEDENDNAFRFVTEEQETLIKERSLMKRSRFKIRRKVKNTKTHEDC